MRCPSLKINVLSNYYWRCLVHGNWQAAYMAELGDVIL